MEPIRILHIVPNMQQGGLENFIMNIYRNIDRTKVQFDFLVHYKKEAFFDKEIEKLGGKIYRLSLREDNDLIKYYKELCNFFKQHKEYKIVHGHMASLGYIYFGIAKKYGVKFRIAHSHGTSFVKNKKGFAKYLMFKLTKYKANIYWACSSEAGKYLFKKRKFEIIPNAIDVKKFIYNEEIRKVVREELGIKNEFVMGHVGRFNAEKNHEFIVEIFKQVYIKNNNAILILIGGGALEDKIKEKVKDLGLENVVRFLGVRKDVNRLYQAMDSFIMPSFFEGLPVTGVEAQASGLNCYFSDSITKEVSLTDRAHFISLNKPANEWAEEIINEQSKNRIFDLTRFYNENYDIKNLSELMKNKYMELYYGED